MSTTPAQPRVESAADLAELMSAFNEVTARLSATHQQLQAEVARLTNELTEANAALERSRRLAALGEMAAGIAHEIRNPLGGIGLYAKMLRDDLGDRPPQRELAEKIMGATRGLNQIVGDVLTFSREFKVRAQGIEAGPLIDRAIEACSHDGVPGWRDVSIERDADAEADVEFVADSGLVQQALVNVLRNAMEAAAEGATTGSAGSSHTRAAKPRVKIVARSVKEKDLGTCAVLGVSDNGPGIAPEVLERMFNPFFTTRAAGTGLGLPIVHRIVDAHGGRVRVKNNSKAQGGGATVELVFPARGAAREATTKRFHELDAGEGAGVGDVVDVGSGRVPDAIGDVVIPRRRAAAEAEA